MLQNLFIFICALFLVIKGATFSTKYAVRLAESFNVSKYTVGFIVVAVISILPETFIAINSALEGRSAFGLGVLFGSNIADLTLVFAIIIFAAGRRIQIESAILKKGKAYSLLLLLPLVLGLDGYFSRIEGLALLIVGAVFYYMIFKDGSGYRAAISSSYSKIHSLGMLCIGMVALLIGAHFIISSALVLAEIFNVSPILISMLVVGLGTTMPEFLFALKSVRQKKDALATGDILGTVMADATVVVGILAVISPFSFSQKIIYVTGFFMVLASIILFVFMRSGKALSKKEALILFGFWVMFVVVEFLVNR
jgi:cation:H+ antiporter